MHCHRPDTAARCTGGVRMRAVAWSVTLCVAGMALSACSHVPSMASLKVVPTYSVGHSSGVDLSYGYIARAREMEQDGRLDQAIHWWAKAVDTAPLRADAMQGLGLCLARSGRLEEGVQALEKASLLSPRDARVFNNLGHALKLQGRTDEARVAFEQALRLDPTHERARYNLAQLQSPLLSMVVSPAAPQPVAPSPVLAARPMVVVQSSPNLLPLAEMTVSVAPLQLKADLTLPRVQEARLPATPDAPTTLAQAEPATQGASAGLTGLREASSLASVRVEVFNGNGMAGAARGLKKLLVQRGVKAERLANLRSYDAPTTRIYYKAGQAVSARQLARMLPVSSELVEASADIDKQMRSELRVVLGHNLKANVAACLTRGHCPSQADVQVAALDGVRSAPN